MGTNKQKHILSTRLIVMNFLQFAVWGAYLTSQGRYLGSVGLSTSIGWFYSIQGIVSIFMPAIMGIIADKWIQAQKVYGFCHLAAAVFMMAVGIYGMNAGTVPQLGILFTLYSLSVAFYMPTLALSYSVSYNALEREGMDTVKAFPPIRVFGTIGFICSMWFVDLMGYMDGPFQYIVSAILGIVLGCTSFTLPACPVASGSKSSASFVQALGLDAFKLFKDSRMAVFFIFSLLLGASLQITNSFANPFLGDFGGVGQYKGSFGVEHSGILISLSQISETLCILLIPFCLRKWGIKKVMLIAMLAWVLRFGFFGLGNPGGGVWLFVLSMIVYGVAFDFFNISGSLFVNKSTDASMRSSAQGLFMLMTNGIGAAVGTIAAQAVINVFVNVHPVETEAVARMAGWQTSWYIFAAYSLIVAVLFAIIFKYKHQPEQ